MAAFFSKLRLAKSKLVLAFVAILLLPSIAIGSISYQSAKSKVDAEMKNAASDSVNTLNETISLMIEAEMNNIDFLSQQIAAESIGTKQGDEDPKVREILDAFKQIHPEVENIAVGTDNGVIMVSPPVQIASDYDPRKTDWYTKANDNQGKVIITDTRISPATGDVVVSIARMVNDNHGVVNLNLSLKALNDMISKVKIGKQGYMVLYDSKRKFLYHPSQKEGGIAVGGDVNGVFASDSGSFDYTNPIDNQPKKLVFTTNPMTGWKLAGTWLVDEVNQEAAPIFHATILVVIISLLAGAIIVFFIVRMIASPLQILKGTAQEISWGDLSQRVEIKSKDEFGELAVIFNLMADSLRAVLVEVSESSSQLAASSEQLSSSAEQTSKATEHIASSIEQMAEGANHQVQTVEDSAQTIQDVSAKIQQIAANAQSVADTAWSAAQKSAEGGRAIQTVEVQMSSINGSVDELAQVIVQLADTSQEIGKITEVITEIAQQTNLLSLNASIEAARAGEHGRGFAVVANEVKKLAEQTSHSAKQIAALIRTICEKIGKAQDSMQTATKEVSLGIEVVHTAGIYFAEIERFVDEVSSQVKDVSTATQQISDGSVQVEQSIEGIAKVAQTTASASGHISAATEEQLASMEEISSSSEALTQMAAELQALVARFKLK
ncbi:chemotaxis protein [Gordoniibacillus kamchatkensis]|uniref:Chemotaxis protein n=1 Tax=Gordoniibacillus kamchatkensis TaxID=1590651 RepID=A0ABR5ALV6_9BACL|nr:chemotaxis protein [Paenibacillus sp. VKM B-2647]